MSIGTKIHTFLLTFLLVRLVFSQDCSRRGNDIRALYRELRDIAEADDAMLAGFLRAAFQDCVTARSQKVTTGCNGSLKFELDDPRNDRLKPVVSRIEQVLVSHPCISLADGIKIAFAAASITAKSGGILGDVVDFSVARKDATEGDYVDVGIVGRPRLPTEETSVPWSPGTIGSGLRNVPSLHAHAGKKFHNIAIQNNNYANGVLIVYNSSLDLPNPLNRSWAYHMGFYQRKGFSAHDLVISFVVGHSIGRFNSTFTSTEKSGPPPYNLKTQRNMGVISRGLLDFTGTSTNRVNGDYCGNLLVKSEFSMGDLPMFNTLPSDNALIDDEDGVNRLRGICSVDFGGTTNYKLQFNENMDDIKTRFRQFAIKMQRLTGQYLLERGF